MNWQLLNTGRASPEVNMALDYDLLMLLSSTSNNVLHFYEWEGNCATYGYFINPAEYIDLHAAKNYRLSLAKRPTGGGITFHVCDLAFSVLITSKHPAYSINIMDSYAFVNHAIAEAVQRFLGSKGMPGLLAKETAPSVRASQNFCMAKPTKYDVMLEGRKVGGGAQRRTKHGYLHQATISLAFPPEEFLKKILKPCLQVIKDMQCNSYSLLGEKCGPEELAEAKECLKAYLQEAFWKR